MSATFPENRPPGMMDVEELNFTPRYFPGMAKYNELIEIRQGFLRSEQY
jgi:hypothetical protein